MVILIYGMETYLYRTQEKQIIYRQFQIQRSYSFNVHFQERFALFHVKGVMCKCYKSCSLVNTSISRSTINSVHCYHTPKVASNNKQIPVLFILLRLTVEPCQFFHRPVIEHLETRHQCVRHFSTSLQNLCPVNKRFL